MNFIIEVFISCNKPENEKINLNAPVSKRKSFAKNAQVIYGRISKERVSHVNATDVMHISV